MTVIEPENRFYQTAIQRKNILHPNKKYNFQSLVLASN